MWSRVVLSLMAGPRFRMLVQIFFRTTVQICQADQGDANADAWPSMVVDLRLSWFRFGNGETNDLGLRRRGGDQFGDPGAALAIARIVGAVLDDPRAGRAAQDVDLRPHRRVRTLGLRVVDGGPSGLHAREEGSKVGPWPEALDELAAKLDALRPAADDRVARLIDRFLKAREIDAHPARLRPHGIEHDEILPRALIFPDVVKPACLPWRPYAGGVVNDGGAVLDHPDGVRLGWDRRWGRRVPACCQTHDQSGHHQAKPQRLPHP